MKIKHSLSVIVAFTSLLSLGVAFAGGEISVSPRGLGPAAALEKIRAARARGNRGEWTVKVANGRYTLTEPLVFKPEDSGIRWVGEPGAAFSGGTVIGG